MTIDDAKSRFLANRAITDPAARAADMEALTTDIAAEWGKDKVDGIFLEVINLMGLESPV